MIKRLLSSPYLLILLLGTVLFLPMLGYVHLFDWDEINFAESAREMLLTGDYTRVTINFQPFWEKPPLFIWMQALSMKVLGVNELAARLPNALCGIATLMVLFHYGRKYRDTSFGWFWVLAYAGSWLPQLYFKSGIIDPVFNLFMFLGVIHLAQWAKAKLTNLHYRHVTLAALFIGLAVLTKGPVGLLLPGLAVTIWIVVRRRWFLQLMPLLVSALVFLAVTFAWYGAETLRNGWWFLGEFLQYNLRLAQTEDSGHGGPFFYHWGVLLLGCFPASILMFYQPKTTPAPTENQSPALLDLRTWMWILLGVVLVVFSIVQTKIVHYSSLAYFPITFLAACTLYRWQDITLKVPRAMVISLALSIGAFGGLLIGGTYFMSTERGWAVIAGLISQTAFTDVVKPWPFYYIFIGLLFTIWAGTGMWTMWKGQLLTGAIRIFIITAVAVQLMYILVLPNIEPLTQGVMVAFLKEQAKEDVYINVLGFKSYAHLYYGEKQPDDINTSAFNNALIAHKARLGLQNLSPSEFNDFERWWHVEGDIDKPVVFVVRAIKSAQIENENPQLKRIGEGGGYVFLKREPLK
ncbi:N/A [soil metagenome]